MARCRFPHAECLRGATGARWRGDLCEYHAMTWNDGRGLCAAEGCRSVRANAQYCRDHKARAAPRLTLEERRIMTRIGDGEDPVAVVAAETGLEPVAAEKALERLVARPRFRDGLEAILLERGIDPADGVVRMWETLIEATQATRTVLSHEGEPVDLGPDWKSRLAAAEQVGKLTTGPATVRQEITATSHQVQIQTYAREPIPADAEFVDAVVDEDE